MGFFDSPGSQYSQQEESLSDLEIKQLVSRSRISSLSTEEESLVESIIEAKKGSDGKISLRQIYTVLNTLENQNRISENDLRELMEIFEVHFGKK